VLLCVLCSSVVNFFLRLKSFIQKSILFEITVKKGGQETNYYINDQPDNPAFCIGTHNALSSVIYFSFLPADGNGLPLFKMIFSFVKINEAGSLQL
jgi:hypothetical protein